MRAAWALAFFSLRNLFRYRDNQLWPLTAPLALVLPALLVGIWGIQEGGAANFAATTGTPHYVAYLLLGAMYWNFVEIVWFVALSLRGAMRTGTLEALWATPLPRLGFLFGWSLARMLVVSPSFLLAIGLILFLGEVPPLSALLEAAAVIILSTLGSYGFAFLLAGLTLRFKDAESLVSILGNSAPLLGGVFFPVTFLPQPLRTLSAFFPFTYGVELLRAAWFGSPTTFPKATALLALAALSLGYLLLGWVSLCYLERKARAHGLEGF